MISAITKQPRRVNKKEWDIYHNIGVQQDADRFSLIDSVLDGEYNNIVVSNEEKAANAKFSSLTGLWKRLKTKLSHQAYKTYLLCWFVFYLGIHIIAKLVR